jgi:GGDEF domain-containing protein
MVDRPQRTTSSPPALYGFIPRTYCAEEVAKRCADAEVADAAERISEDIRSFDWSVIQPGLKVTASLGIAVHDQHQHIDKTVETADAFLYAAKQAGRDCWMYRPQRRAA